MLSSRAWKYKQACGLWAAFGRPVPYLNQKAVSRSLTARRSTARKPISLSNLSSQAGPPAMAPRLRLRLYFLSPRRRRTPFLASAQQAAPLPLESRADTTDLAHRISRREGAANDHHALSNTNVLLATGERVIDGKLCFAELVVAAKGGVVFDDDFEEGIRGAGRLKGLVRELDGASGSFNMAGFVDFFLAELDEDTQVGARWEAVGG